MIWSMFSIIIVVWLFNQLYWKRRKLPPGPTPLPLIGNLHSVLWHFPGLVAYNRWKDEYGPLYTHWLGTMPVVTANDYDTIQEMFVHDGDNYADRASLSSFTEEFRGGILGVIETSGDVWREQRRFALHTLRDFGLGKNAMEERILDEVVGLLDAMEAASKATGTTKPIGHIEQSVASVINLVIFGYRFDEKTVHELHENRRLQDEVLAIGKNPLAMLPIFFPKLEKVWPFGKIKRRIMDIRDKQFAFYERNIEKHRSRIDLNSEEIEDFCDAYLREIERQKDYPDSTFHDKQFVNVCIDLWSAGMETTALTLSWAFILLVHNQEVLQKLHDEYDRVIGSDRLITMLDKNSLPYTNAFINEVQRFANIIPQNLMRTTRREVVVNGYTIPAGTTVCPQISMLLIDPKVFPEPERFNPDRFLDENGRVRIVKELMPFSVGKRQCLGEGLARMELFLFIANITQRFQISAADVEKLPSLEKKLSTFGKPAPFEVKLERRNHA